MPVFPLKISILKNLSNHHLAKYKEEGIVNGARGYIDSIQVCKENRTEVEVIWIVFKDKTVGRLLRYDYGHLKKLHKPISEDAVPILRQKKNFTINKGEVRFQRTQFPITLAYAITAYKCQGDTLEEVIIDFSHEPGERANIQWGSFYVALTRVKEGRNVYLKSFDESYITFNERVENKIAAMREFKAYTFKKIYVSDPIFKENNKEVKLGYFNMRGFLESNHAKYLDHDKNLLKLHFLIISETWLTSDIPNKIVIEKLKNWRIIKRLDATDNKKHMGLLLLAPNNFEDYKETIFSMDYSEGYRNEKLLYQGIILDLKLIYKKIVCLYIRKTPNEKESLEIAEKFKNADCIMGDLNLNPSDLHQKSMLLKISGNDKSIALEEITTINNKQLDHIILKNEMAKCSFTTSYLNFASDHKSLVIRIPLPGNEFSEHFLEQVNFDSNHHLKRKKDKADRMAEPESNIFGARKKTTNKLNVKRLLISNEGKETKRSKSTVQQETEKVGTENKIILRFLNPSQRNLCFSNSAATCLLNIPAMKDFFLENQSNNEDQNLLLSEMSNLAHLKNLTTASTERLRNIVKMQCFKSSQWTKNFNNNMQHDAGEFLQSLLEHLWREPATPPNLVERIFGGLCQNTVHCQCGNIEELQVQHMSEVIPIQIKGESVQSCLEDYLAAENIERNCSSCNRSEVLRKSSIINEPRTLILQLMRYKYNEIHHTVTKINAKINCPPRLVLPSGSTYHLSSVINHIGEDTTSGHYNTLLYDKENKKFLLIDDSTISNNITIDEDINRLSYIFIYIKDT